MAGRSDKQDPDVEMGVFMISVAAELTGMHPQTLRIYEQRGLIKPKRSPRQTRLYSRKDVERLHQIQELTSEMGMNLAGVERVFELQEVIEDMEVRMEESKRQLEQMRQRLHDEIEAVHRSYRREIVIYNPHGTDVVKASDVPAKSFQIPIEHRT